MNILMLSSFPPTKCGIGAYANQHARRLEEEGHDVRRFDIHKLNAAKWRGALLSEFETAVKISDKVIVQYQPSLLRSPRGLPLLKSLVPYSRLTKALRYGPQVEIVIHENFNALTPAMVGLQESFATRLFQEATVATFHTKVEAERFDFPVKKKQVVAPEKHYHPFTSLSQMEARDELGIRQDRRVFVAAGFYHPGKGFERLVKAFLPLRSPNQLYIVTSDREVIYERELSALRQLAKTKNISIVNRYVNDREFDNWLQASDVVVVPYERGFTSSILARASLYGKTCVASSLPAIKEQDNGNILFFDSDEELGRVLRGLSI